MPVREGRAESSMPFEELRDWATQRADDWYLAGGTDRLAFDGMSSGSPSAGRRIQRFLLDRPPRRRPGIGPRSNGNPAGAEAARPGPRGACVVVACTRGHAVAPETGRSGGGVRTRDSVGVARAGGDPRGLGERVHRCTRSRSTRSALLALDGAPRRSDDHLAVERASAPGICASTVQRGLAPG